MEQKRDNGVNLKTRSAKSTLITPKTNKIVSIKARITVWYTILMFTMITFVLAAVGLLSYQLSLNNIENSLKSQVTQISERVKERIPKKATFAVEYDE